MGKRLFIFGLLLTIVTAVWAQEPTQTTLRADSATRAVSRTGKAGTGCDTASFVTRKGETFLARKAEIDTFPRANRRVARTGQLLTFDIQVLDSVLGCGITDEEALVEITILWNYDYMPKIIERGLLYRHIDSVRIDTVPDVLLKKEDCGDGTFQILIDSLDPGETYVTRAYAITIAQDTFLSERQFVTQYRTVCKGLKKRDNEEENAEHHVNLVRDHEGNQYRVVQIGSQCWTKENMRCSSSPSGRLNPAQTVAGRNDKYEVSYYNPYYYSYDALNISFRQRGNLYNWPAAVDTFGSKVRSLPPGFRRGICPEGWHVPDRHEWYEMVQGVLSGLENTSFEEFYSKKTFQGDSVVKLTFGCDWPDSTDSYPGGYMDHPERRNSSHFTALPTSNVQDSGTLGWTKKVANFWLAETPGTNTTTAYSWHIDDDQKGVSSYARERRRGFSVRCLRNTMHIVSDLSGRQCMPSNATYTIADEERDNITYTWFVNGDTMQSGDSKVFQYTHNVPRQDTIKCHATRTGYPELQDIDIWDSIYYLPKFPSIVLCRDAIGINGFVIKGSDNLYGANWYDSNNQLIIKKTKIGDTVLVEGRPSPYWIAMTDPDCKDTLKNVSKIIPKIGCKIWDDAKYNERLRDEESDIIDSVLDHEGNRYAVVDIGGQCWLRENMRATTSPTPPHNRIIKPNTISSYQSMAAHWYNNDSAKYNRFGVLYNWLAAVDSFKQGADPVAISTTNSDNAFPLTFSGNRRGICPEGWHVPTADEWMTLELFVYGGALPSDKSGTARGNHAGKLSAGADWNNYSSNVEDGAPSDFNNPNRNWSGFSAIPAGWCNPDKTPYDTNVNALAIFWSATQFNKNGASARELSYSKAGVIRRGGQDKNRSMSVRCVRDIKVMALHLMEGTCGQGHVTAAPPSGVNVSSYKWIVNGVVIPDSTNNTLSFDFDDETNSYHVVCEALNSDNSVICLGTKNIQLPSMTLMVDSFAGAFKIQDTNTFLTKAYWKLNNDTISTAISGYVDGLQSGNYSVEMYYGDNGDTVCKMKNIVLNIVHTQCVLSNNTTRNDNEAGPTENTSVIDSVQDRAGNWYRVVQIDNQCWLRENMRTIKDTNGVGLKLKSENQYSSTERCYYNYASTGIPLRQRGYLYNWNAASSICPEGWKLPLEEDWDNLASTAAAGNAQTCRMACVCYWEPNTNTNNNRYPNSPGDYSAVNRNSSGFTLVPAGNSNPSGKFQYSLPPTYDGTGKCDANSANFWTGTLSNTTSEYVRIAFDNWRNWMTKSTGPIRRGMSVRCIRDTN
jgi:uncharacterized protein (TIGR02145 family)